MFLEGLPGRQRQFIPSTSHLKLDEEDPVAKEDAVNRETVRTLLTILMYAGVGIFLLPYALGKASIAPLLMLLGGIIAVVCGLLRCYLTEGE